MTITAESIIQLSGFAAATIALIVLFAKGVRWVDEQKKQSEEIKTIKAEQSLLIYGILACLQGLKEQGCDGTVTETISKIEKHLNIQAHK